MKLVVLVATVALLEYVYFGLQVGRARSKYPRRSLGVLLSFPIALILLVGGAIGAFLD